MKLVAQRVSVADSKLGHAGLGRGELGWLRRGRVRAAVVGPDPQLHSRPRVASPLAQAAPQQRKHAARGAYLQRVVARYLWNRSCME